MQQELRPSDPDGAGGPPATPERPRRHHSLLRDVAEIAIIAGVLYLAIWTALQTVRVEGQSMVATLHNQDLLLASKVSYYFGANPARGDIVVLIPPSDPSRDFIKRVIGLPGDELEIDGTQSPPAVLIKPGGRGGWERLQEPYLPERWTQMDNCCLTNGSQSARPQPVAIPAGDYFVMGDNRNFSSDSRSFGFVPRKNILAKAFLRILPLGQFSLGPGPSLVAAGSAAPSPTASASRPAAPPATAALGIALAAAPPRRRRRKQRCRAPGP